MFSRILTTYGTMDHNRSVLMAICPPVLKLKALWQLEVKLNTYADTRNHHIAIKRDIILKCGKRDLHWFKMKRKRYKGIRTNLDGCGLMLSVQSIAHMDVYFRTIECSICQTNTYINNQFILRT